MKNLLLFSMIFSMMLWGLSWPSAKFISNFSSPVNLTIYRYFFVVISLLPVLLIFKIKLKVQKKGIPFILISGTLLACYSYLMFEGLKQGFSGAGGVFVTTLNPIMAYFLALLIKRQKPNRFESIGLLLGLLAGCVLLRAWENLDAISSSGNLYFLGAAFLWATMSRFTAVANKYGSPFSFSFWMYLVTLLVLIPLMDWQGLQNTLAVRDAYFWGNLIFGGTIVTALATTVYFYATSQLGSEKASSFIFMVPFAAALSSWIFLGEKIEIHTIIGGVLGIAAVYLINRKQS